MGRGLKTHSRGVNDSNNVKGADELGCEFTISSLQWKILRRKKMFLTRLRAWTGGSSQHSFNGPGLDVHWSEDAKLRQGTKQGSGGGGGCGRINP